MESGDRERAHVFVAGQVQGVFFRDSTRERAEQLGLTGWVKNLPDGRVEAVFEGSPERVREMIQWCEQGPPHAAVEEVESEFEASKGDLERFEVR
jgi:acylphosphatase